MSTKLKQAFRWRIPVSLILIAALTSCSSNKKDQPQRPNIIYIMSDDHAYQAISAYGGLLADLAPTPNIDRIAKQGMRFNRCLVTNSLCGPSRATILTGKYGHLNGFVDNTAGSKFDFGQETFTKILQKAGYKTAVIGKLHLGGEPTGFDYYDILPGQGRYYNPEFIDQKQGKYETQGYVTEIITQKAIDWLKQVKDDGQPFLLMMHHKAPHRNWEPGPHEMGMFENTVFPEPVTLFDDYSGNRKAAALNNMTIAHTMRLNSDLKLTDDAPAAMNEEQKKAWNAVYGPIFDQFKKLNPQGDELVRYKYQRYMRDYLSCIAGVDKSVGEVLDYLKESGLDKNTIVVYTSDQGFYLGEHGWFDKRWMYKESLHTPLLIRWPGIIQAGTVNNNMVSNLDFAETFLDIAGAKIPDDMQGRSILPILEGKTPSDWRTSHYYHYYEHPSEHNVMRHYGITTDRYKLIHFYYDIDDWELYDLQKDPMEMKNVYGDPAYKDIQDQLHTQLEALRAKYKDSDSLNQVFIDAYNAKVKANPKIEYWKFRDAE